MKPCRRSGAGLILQPFLFACFASAAVCSRAAEDWPLLRQTNYVALLGTDVQEISIQLRSRQRSPSYADRLRYALVERDGAERAGSVPLGAQRTITARPLVGCLNVLEIEPGFNAASVAAGAAPLAYIASDTIPLRCVGPSPRLYFYVPAGCPRFTLSVMAEVAREAARLVVYGPDGQVVKEDEGDYDARTTLKIDVARAARAQVWSLSIERPKERKLHLDKVALSLGSTVPPYLCKRPEWAQAFGVRKTAHGAPSSKADAASKTSPLIAGRESPTTVGQPRDLSHTSSGPTPGSPDGRTVLPVTYILDYGPQHINTPAYVEQIAAAPPSLLHLGKDVPLTHNWGPIQALGGENQAYGKRRPFGKEDDIRRLSPDELRQRTADLMKLAADLHRVGARWVTPYICGMTIAGHPDTRAGLWEFYDHWSDYGAFGLGPRPAADPLDWMQRMPDGSLQTFYKYSGDFYPAYEPNRRYAACVNNRHWRAWLEKVVENVARCGFDGVFVDNGGSQRCYCACCRAKWRAWIERRYSAAQRQELFGAPRPELGQPVKEMAGESALLWAETCRFWSASLAEHLAAIGRAGQRVLGRPFVVFPNGGEQRPEQVLRAFADADLVMFERSFGPYGTHPGTVRWNIVEDMNVKRHNDNVFENKFVQCLRRKVRPVMLTAPGWQVPRQVRRILEMNPASALLGCAETAAFGGGGGFLVRMDRSCGAVQRQFRDFMETQRALYEGLDSWAPVAVACFPELTWLGNRRHAQEIRRVTQELLDAHVLFDYVIEDQFTAESLKKYTAVILPDVSHLSDARLAVLRDFVRGGGVALAVGPLAQFDELARPRDPSVLDDLFDKARAPNPQAIKSVGRGRTFAAAELPVDHALSGWLDRAVGRPLSALRGPSSAALAKVRISVFRRPGAKQYVVHLLNYNVVLGVDAPEPDPLRGLEVALPLPECPQEKVVRCHDPLGSSVDLASSRDGQTLRFTVPELSVYRVIQVGP